MKACVLWHLDPTFPHQLAKNNIYIYIRVYINVVKVRPPLTKLSGSTHDWGVS